MEIQRNFLDFNNGNIIRQVCIERALHFFCRHRGPCFKICGLFKGVYSAVGSPRSNELEILLEVPKEKLFSSVSGRLAEGIMRVRQGQVNILPGYDGEYGKIEIFSAKEKGEPDKQLSLF